MSTFLSEAPYLASPTMGYLGSVGHLGAKASKHFVRGPLSPALQARLQKIQSAVATKKAARCAKRQQHLQAACDKAQQRLSARHLYPKALVGLSANLSRRCTNKAATLNRICSTPVTVDSNSLTSTDDQNIVDAADLAGAMADWQSCMQDQKTCATDDCGFQKDCADPDKDYQAQCISDWKDCMAGDKTCATDWCGTKPVAGLSGLSGLGESAAAPGNTFALIGLGLLAWYFFSFKKK